MPHNGDMLLYNHHQTIMFNDAYIVQQIEHLKENTNILGLMTLAENYVKKP
jgi:hypothetical protein